MRWQGRSEPASDVVFVLAESSRGWILDRICKEISRRAAANVHFHYGDGPLPPAHAYFFSHYLLFLDASHDRRVRSARSVVLFTHPSYSPDRARGVARQLRRASAVASICSMHGRSLVEDGLPSRKVAVVIPGADPDRFAAHRRGGGVVGFCSAYYPRKAPGRVLGIVRALPERRFVLVGRGWQDAPEFTSLQALPNFEYRQADYDEYPRLYREFDVFVSCATMEGGPVPLLEAMMCNAVPVATRTGFAPDLIDDGKNGFLCATDAPVSEFVALIEAAFKSEADVRTTVERYTWKRFAHEILTMMRVASPSPTVPGDPQLEPGSPVHFGNDDGGGS